MSLVKLMASDDNVINYLKLLWSSSKVLKINDFNESIENNSQVQSQSLIQTLIDNNIISNQKLNPEMTNPEMTNPEMTNPEMTNLEMTNPEMTNPDMTNLEMTNPDMTNLEMTNPEMTNPISKLNLDDTELVNNLSKDILEINNKTKFKKQVKENLAKLREIGFRVYYNISLEKEVNLIPNTVTDQDINKVYAFKTRDKIYKTDLMKDISRCTIFPKYKYGDVSKPENFRYLINHHNTIKILDRLWCIELITKIKDNIPDQQIYKANLVNRFNISTSDIAIYNTQSIDSIVLLDIEKAFDSLEWDILENLLISNLTRKSNNETAQQLVDQYMTILKNRELYYNNKQVPFSKGISTGLPSSNLVFTLAIEEIINRWFNKTNYKNNKEFIINVYIDDIFIKVLELDKTHQIINSLIDFLTEYKLNVNSNKSKADKKLQLDNLSNLKPTDFYLGIPFTRDIKLYGKLILHEFNIKKLNWNWERIYDELCKDVSNNIVMENQRVIIGFMNYKLRPFLNKESNETIKEQIKQFIFNNWVREIKYWRNKFIMIITTILTILIAIVLLTIIFEY